MALNGLRKFSLIDYPGKLCCVAFFGGCNFRCPFCHNPSLVFDPASQGTIPPEEFASFLKGRRDKLDAVVFSGGEPTLDPAELRRYAACAHELGFKVRIDSNGSHPQVLRELAEAGLADSFGIDCKGPAAKYAELTGNQDPGLPSRVHQSIRFAVDSGLDCEVRTTVHASLLRREDLRVMADELARLGVRHFVLQQFHRAELVDETLNNLPTYSDGELRAIASELGSEVRVRGTLN